MTTAYVSPDTLIALPGGGQVSAGFLASQGVYSYGSNGQVLAPTDAYAVGFGGSTYEIGQHTDWFAPYDPVAEQHQANDAADKASAAASNRASIVNLLRQFGLDELLPLVDQWVQSNLSASEIEAQLYDRSSAAGKIVDRLYPELRQRQESGAIPMSIQQIQRWYQDAQQRLAAAGIPEGLRTKDFLRQRLVDDVSVDEIGARADAISEYGARLANHPEAAGQLSAFQRFYGVHLTAAEIGMMALDEKLTLPALRQRIAAVGEDVAAQQSGYGELSRSEAESLVDSGVSTGQATEGFGQLATAKELFTPLPGQQNSEDTISREEQIGSIAGNANAARRIRQRAQQRVASFQGGGGFAQTQEGFAGLGTAR